MLSSLLTAFVFAPTIHGALISRDARCGQINGATCLKSQYGSCCSQYGWCGSTGVYCGVGCQSRFGTYNIAPSPSLRSSSSIRVSPTSTRSPTPPAIQPVSRYARCGSSFGGQTCKGSQWGDCCSQSNYCGTTPNHCSPSSCQANYGRCDKITSSSRTNPLSSSLSSIRSSTRTLVMTIPISTSSTSKPLSSSSSLAAPFDTSQRVTSTTKSQSSSQTSTSIQSIASSSSTISVSSTALSSSTATSSTMIKDPISAVSSTPLGLSSISDSSSLAAPAPSTEVSSAQPSVSAVSSPTPDRTPTPTPTLTPSVVPTPEPIASQLVINPSFENNFNGWRIQGSQFRDNEATGVKSGDGRTGTNAFQGVGTAQEWFVDISQNLLFIPNTAYTFEFWAKATAPDCTAQGSILGKVDGIDLSTSYQRFSVSVSAEENTPAVIADSAGMMLVDLFCASSGPGSIIYVDDVTVTSMP
ncbi:hypothetical protein DE146DRAFT_765070 [Phaeosphaeria sp. MPI-PUGE-AT-0046c]|nr:hypothetical protein DE146DRAFT_765070 [Phaeosphaeria sp. MPI-PUGE-AT-0046c]